MAFAHHLHSGSRAQSLIDYVIVVGIVAAALIAMRVYMVRGVQAGIKVAADELGSQEGLAFETEYVAASVSEMTSYPDDEISEAVAEGGSLERRLNLKTTSEGWSWSQSEEPED